MKNYKINYYKNKSEINYKDYVLGCDIGGTYTNIAIAGIKNNKPNLIFSLDYNTKNLDSIVPAINEAMNIALNNYKIHIDSVCIGAAGPIYKSNKNIKLTNINWNINKDKILELTSLSEVKIINDFQIIGYGINLLNHNNPNDIILIKKGRNNTKKIEHTRAIIGTGTGLGKAILNYDKKMEFFISNPSEGGHSDIPIDNDFEMELISYIKLIKKTKNPIIYEDILSGRGLINIYKFIRNYNLFEETKYTKEIDKLSDKTPLISKYRLKDKTCNEVFKIFTTFYSRCAKNFVLETFSIGGLYIAGGISIKNKDIFFSKTFLNEFQKNSDRNNILQNIPIYLIKDYKVSIKGACFAAMLNIENF